MCPARPAPSPQQARSLSPRWASRRRPHAGPPSAARPPAEPAPCRETSSASHGHAPACSCAVGRWVGTGGLRGGQPHPGPGQAEGRAHHSSAPRHSHLLSLAPSGWLQAGQRPSLQRPNSAKTLLSPHPTRSLGSLSTLHLGCHLGLHRPSVRLRGARHQHVHTGCGCMHTRVTRLQMSPYPPRRCRGGLCVAGPTRWGSAHTHTLTLAHHTVDTPAPHVKALSTAGGVGRHLGTIGQCVHTRVHAPGTYTVKGGAGGVHTCSPVPRGSGVAGGLSRAGLGQLPHHGHTLCSPSAFGLCPWLALMSAPPDTG